MNDESTNKVLPIGWLPYTPEEISPPPALMQPDTRYYLSRDSESGLIGWVPFDSEPEPEPEHDRINPTHQVTFEELEKFEDKQQTTQLVNNEKLAWRKRKQALRNRITRIRQHAKQKGRQLIQQEQDEIAAIKQKLEHMRGHYTQQVTKSRLDVIEEKIDYLTKCIDDLLSSLNEAKHE
jgi:thymidylate synthase